jgi:hypothetical protein
MTHTAGGGQSLVFWLTNGMFEQSIVAAKITTHNESIAQPQATVQAT